ncbi:MAG: hypothetical protein JO119_00420 [Acidobacteria bacterium]|nr:hypothetical protein [Acidobacteriota bacterium]
MRKSMKVVGIAAALVSVVGIAGVAHLSLASGKQNSSGHMMSHSMHTNGAALTYAELQNTAAELERARKATEKYKDVQAAEGAGYQALGGEVPGMGVHYVLTMEPDHFDVEKPPILLYVKDAASTGGYTLGGVGYLWNGPDGSDGQPANPPFPKSLAVWHKHDNVCMLPHLDNPHGLTEAQCTEKGGHFVAKTQWLVHAWIWKDNPTGIFSAENPAVR